MERNFTEHIEKYMNNSSAEMASQSQFQEAGLGIDDAGRPSWSQIIPSARSLMQGQATYPGSGRPLAGNSSRWTSPALAPTTKPYRLSLPSQASNIYNRQDREPDLVSNTNNYFKIRQNLHGGATTNYHTPRVPSFTQPLQHAPNPVSQYQPVNALYSRQAQEPDTPVTKVVNAMMMNKQIPLRRLQQESDTLWQQQQEQQNESRISKLRAQQQQITPPFHKGGLYSVEDQAIASSSSPVSLQASSPSEQISLRRTANRPSQAQYLMSGANNVEETLRTQNSASDSTPMTSRPKEALNLAHAPPIVRGIQLVSPYELSDKVRQIFPYELFNAVQSKCFKPIYHSDDNIVVSAPTGSGKTALLELAICRLVEVHRSGDFKIVYQAPTRSLCSERHRDWQKKFSHLNLQVAELTGDTNQKELNLVRNASIIVTTPEKWDSITRKWSDHDRLVKMVKLFLIDEVHILKDTRGATLEAVVSRMKRTTPDMRFVALSATVPNSHDIAIWLGRDPSNGHLPAHKETFGEDFRPVKLQKFVYGFDGNKNDFVFEKILDKHLATLIAKHTHGKPIMVFCFTRNICETTAAELARWWTQKKVKDRAWKCPSRTISVQNKALQDVVGCGVAFHHAGLDPPDRAAVEQNYLKGELSVICCTTTLAVGVNLPCHLVVLKGTVGYQDGVLTEYADLEVMQMLGRAGRPQFDDNAVAVILTRKERVERYKKMVSGQDILESTLHLNLIEHLNSEISLGTVQSTTTAKKWLKSTFLSVRMRQNPSHYRMEGVPQIRDVDLRLEMVCDRDIKLLREAQLIDKNENFSCTAYGQAMSTYMVQFESMRSLLAIPHKAKTEEILHALCQAAEFKDLRIKPIERPHLRQFNKSPFIKYPIKENIATTTHKIMLLVQIQLGGVEYPNDKDFNAIRRQFSIDTNMAMERINRLIRCVIDCKSHDNDAISTRHALDLARSISAGYWENSNLQLRQLESVGPAAARKFASNDITTVESLSTKDTFDIERIMSKNPPYGRKLLDQLAAFPRFKLLAIITKQITQSKTNPRVNVLATLSFLNKSTPTWKNKRPALTFTAETTDGKLVHFWRGNIARLERNGFEIKFTADISGSNEVITCYVACEDIVGTMKSVVVKPVFSESAFPAQASQERSNSTSKMARNDSKSTSSDEFAWDGDEEAIVEAVKRIDAVNKEIEEEDFVDIEDFEDANPVVPQKTTRKVSASTNTTDSVLLPNGKWTCNHACSGGQLLKNGNPCKHKCCMDGIDKPRKPKPKSSSNNIQKDNMEEPDDMVWTTVELKQSVPPDLNQKVELLKSKYKLHDTKTRCQINATRESEDVKVINLADNASTSYSSARPRNYQKLHALHTETQEDKPIRLANRRTSTSQCDDNFTKSQMNKDEDTFDDGGIAEDDFPDVSDLLSRVGEYDFDEAKEGASVSNDEEKTELSEYGDPIENCNDNVADPGYLAILYPSSSIPSKGDLGFADDLFDFEAAADTGSNSIISASTSSRQQMAAGSPSSLVLAKRDRSLSPQFAAKRVRRRRHCEQDIQEKEVVDTSPLNHLSSMPDWVNDFDPELIEGLRGFVEFVD